MVFGIEYNSSESLRQALKCYTDKIPRLLWRLYNVLYIEAHQNLSAPQKTIFIQRLNAIRQELNTTIKPVLDIDDISALQNKIQRLRAKRVAVIAELDQRKITGEPATVHHTNYFIDFVDGSDSNDGLTPGNPWKTLANYTTTTVRSAGDVAYVRRAKTETVSVSIEVDEDGDPNNPIIVMADDGTGWSGEEGNAIPIIDYSTNSVYLNVLGDNHWKFDGIEFNNGTNSYGHVRVGGLDDRFYNCKFEDCDGGAYGVVFVYQGFEAYFENCEWNDNAGSSFRTLGSDETATLKDCTFDGNAICINVDSGIIYLYNVNFGGTSANSSWDINISSAYHVEVRGRNIVFNDTNKVNLSTTAYGSFVVIEDYGGTKLDNRAWYAEGTIVRNTVTVRGGGADSSAECVPKANCGTLQPLKMFEIPIWCPASSTTVTIYLRGTSWASMPTAAQLWIEAEYYDGATAERAILKSTNVLTANDTWTAFSVTFTPNSASPVYIRGYLADYEDGSEEIFVDIKPVIS